MMLVSGWRRLVLVITGFTLAHSVTWACRFWMSFTCPPRRWKRSSHCPLFLSLPNCCDRRKPAHGSHSDTRKSLRWLSDCCTASALPVCWRISACRARRASSRLPCSISALRSASFAWSACVWAFHIWRAKLPCRRFTARAPNRNCHGHGRSGELLDGRPHRANYWLLTL